MVDGNGAGEGDGPGGPISLKNPPSMHLRDDMAKRRVKTTQGYKVMECALTWEQFERKYEHRSNSSS